MLLVQVKLKMKVQTMKMLISILALFLFSSPGNATSPLAREIQDALKSPAQVAGERLYQLGVVYIIMAPIDSAAGNKDKLLAAVLRSNLADKKLIALEMKAWYAKRLMNLQQAKYYVLQALNKPNVPKIQLIRLLMLLAYVNTDLENYKGALESYQLVEKLLVESGNTSKLIFTYASIGDLYIKCALYKESIMALNKAFKLTNRKTGADTLSMIYENKAIAYFYLKNLDSLQYYTHKLITSGSHSAEGAIGLHRLRYMSLLLKKDSAAITEIKTIQNNPLDGDKLNTNFQLAQAYEEFNQTERAKETVINMLATGDIKNLGHLGGKLYLFLGDIYQKENNFGLSSCCYQKSLGLSALNAANQLKSESIIGDLKYYEIRDKYVMTRHELDVKKSYLALSTIIALMIISLLFFLYRSIRIRKRYNEFRFAKLNEEIAMMNSHEVRKHLANILGIMTVIEISDDRYKTYMESEHALKISAEHLDISIKHIADKLNKKNAGGFEA